MMKINYKHITLLLIISAFTLNAQVINSGTHELQRTLFISEVHGLTSIFINPAGLASLTNDDGILLGYSGNDKEKGEFIFSMSIGDIGAGYKESKIYEENIEYVVKEYAVALAAGTKFISIGTTTKLIEYRTGDQKEQNYNFDAGINFQPLSFIGFSAIVRNLHIQDQLPDLLNRNFQVGTYIEPLGSMFRILAEIVWKDAQEALKQGNLKTAVELKLANEFDIRFGTYNFNQPKKAYFIAMNVHLVEGMRFYSSVRFNEFNSTPNFLGSLIIPLETPR
ncbi:MAG: hypothetical protein KKB34_05810 [Bacteroidetes bacterium]|jgi:hypothetical protein|nr:hypothetical protein [Bacteroidota bacterium]